MLEGGNFVLCNVSLWELPLPCDGLALISWVITVNPDNAGKEGKEGSKANLGSCRRSSHLVSSL